ncbi:MAG TPA: hypothetical protein IAB62_12000 [Candidatus Coprocola pullicola]|nr:hypothetical protein [Candidatus Coprocola pullicola]
MEFDLCFNTNLDFDVFSKIVIKNFEKVIKAVDLQEDNDGIYLNFKYFSITILKEIYGIELYDEEYGIKVNTNIEISLLNNIAEEGMRFVLNVIGILIKELEGDAIFVGESSVVILKKMNDKIFVYNNPEQYYFKISFDDLNLKSDDIIVVK